MTIFTTILMAVGPWIFVITLIIGLGKLNISMTETSQEMVQDSTQDTDKILSLGSEKQLMTERGKADFTLRSAA